MQGLDGSSLLVIETVEGVLQNQKYIFFVANIILIVVLQNMQDLRKSRLLSINFIDQGSMTIND
jgi:hypothetical protein